MGQTFVYEYIYYTTLQKQRLFFVWKSVMKLIKLMVLIKLTTDSDKIYLVIKVTHNDKNK